MSSISLAEFFPQKREFVKHLFSPCTLGFIREEEHKGELKKLLNYEWNFRYRRPFKVVYRSRNGVFVVLLTTSGIDFYCKTDGVLKLNRTPQVDTEKCEKEPPECQWIKGVSRLFKVRAGKRNCYVFHFAPAILHKMGRVCGRCDENALDKEAKKVVAYELKKYWGIEVERDGE